MKAGNHAIDTTLKGRDTMTTISIEIDDVAARILDNYAALKNQTATEYVYQALMKRLEDERETHPNAATMQAIDDVEHKRNLVGPFHSVDDLMRDLNA